MLFPKCNVAIKGIVPINTMEGEVDRKKEHIQKECCRDKISFLDVMILWNRLHTHYDKGDKIMRKRG